MMLHEDPSYYNTIINCIIILSKCELQLLTVINSLQTLAINKAL